MLSWCERNNVQYIVRISSNAKLEKLTMHIAVKSERKYRRTKVKSKLYTEIYYCAGTWKNIKRKIFVKAELTDKGKNLRYIEYERYSEISL